MLGAIRAAGACFSVTVRMDPAVRAAIAARIARHGRGHITVHLPEGWHRDCEWTNLFEAACGPPRARAA